MHLCSRVGLLLKVPVTFSCVHMLAGRGVNKDVQTALNYYGMAFDLGHWKAAYALGKLYAGNEREWPKACMW